MTNISNSSNISEPVGIAPEFNDTGIKPDPEDMTQSIGALIVRPMPQVLTDAAKQPIPRQLAGSLINEGELSVLFSDTGRGKTVFAFQLADAWSKGTDPISCLENETEPQTVFYLDCEMTDKQLENRCSHDWQDHYELSDNFLRAELNPEAITPKDASGNKISYHDFILQSIEAAILKLNAKIVIVDNISFLIHDHEKLKNAQPLMQRLYAIKKRYGVTILVVAHTPKRDKSRPISQNDLAGSKALQNFIDTLIAIGDSAKDPHLRYLKTVKMRSRQEEFTEDNVILMELSKPDNFLHFRFVQFCREVEHLERDDDDERTEKIAEAKELKSRGMNYRQIASEIGVSTGSVHNYLNT